MFNKKEFLNDIKAKIYFGHIKPEEVFKYMMIGVYDVQKDKEESIQNNIGMLRQYLNERTSEDLITDEEIKLFLK